MAFDAQDCSYLHVGDIISLYTEGLVTGFLSSLGIVDDRVVVEPDNGHTEDIPKKFRDCLFELCPVNRYASQRELWKYEKRLQPATSRDPDQAASMLKALRIAAQKEKDQNDHEAEMRRGKVLQYGEAIQLRHFKSRKFLTVNRTEAAKEERIAFRVYLDNEGNEGSIFYIEPFLKIRTVGDKLVVGDKIMLVPSVGASRVTSSGSTCKNQIHVSQHAVRDLPANNYKEVNCLSERTCWKVNLFLTYDENQPKILKGGDVVRLFHAEKQMYLTLDTFNHVPTVYLRKTDQADARMALNPKALWEVEVVQQNSVRGARGKWSDLYRFKHLATDMYLVAELDNQPPTKDKEPIVVAKSQVSSGNGPCVPTQRSFKLVAVPSCANERSSLFQLDPTTVISSTDEFVPESAYIRLRHFFTGTWVHSTDFRYDGKSMFKVGCAQTREDREAYYIVPVPAAEVRDLDFANDSARSLKRFHEGLVGVTKESFTLRALNSLKALLGELIIFLCYRNLDSLYSYGTAELLEMKPKVKSRSRQKMLREQNVLEGILQILTWAVEESSAWRDDKSENTFRVIFRLCQYILKLSLIGYRKNQEYIAKKFKLLQDQIGLNIGAEDTITTLMNANPDLKACIKDTNIDEFVNLVRKHRQAKYLDYLSILCASNGLPIAEIQEKICGTVLAIGNLDTLIYTHDQVHPLTQEFVPGAVFLEWEPLGKEHMVRELHDLTRSQMDSDREMLEFYQHQLELFSNMCLGRSFLAIDNDFFSTQLSVELILRCMSDEKLKSYPLRASFARLMLHLHVDKDPQDQIDAIHYARLWQEVPARLKNCSGSTERDLLDRAEVLAEDKKRQLAREEFQPTISFVVNYLSSIKKDGFRCRAKNIFSQNVIVLAKYMVYFGFYKLQDLMSLTKVLLDILDCIDSERIDLERQKSQKSQKDVRQKIALQALKSLHSMGQGIGGWLAAGRHLSSELNETDEAVLKAKLTIVDILQFTLNVRLDHRVTCLLAMFKEKQQSLTSAGDENGSRDDEDDENHSGVVTVSHEETMDLARMLLSSDDETDQENPMRLSIDLDNGRQLLRILLYLIMHNYAPLVSGALGLLFRHFSQLHELVNTFKQVQLLVSSEDISNYQLIRSQLTKLKYLIDKSELWVNKKERKMTASGVDDHLVSTTPTIVRTGGASGDDFDVCALPMVARSLRTDEVDDPLKAPFETFEDILDHLCRLCYKEAAIDYEGANPVPSKTNQQLLRNMKVHESILAFLCVPIEHMSSAMQNLISKSHEFLRRFCLGNRESQQFLAQHVQFGHGFSSTKALKVETVEDVQTLNAIYKDNRDLCSSTPEELVAHVVSLLDRSERNRVFITFLQILVKPSNTSIARTQSIVMEQLSNASDEVLLLFNDKHTFAELEELMKVPESYENSNDLLYHIELVKLLSLCTEEKNGDTELKAANLLTINDIVRVMESPYASYLIKNTYVNFLYHCYVDTDVEIIKEAYHLSRVWKCFEVIADDIKQVRVCGPDGPVHLVPYVIQTCVDQLLCKFFAKMSVEDNQWNELLQPHNETLQTLIQRLMDLELCQWLSGTQVERIGTCKRRMLDVARRNHIAIPSLPTPGPLSPKSFDEDTCRIDTGPPDMFSQVAKAKSLVNMWTTRRRSDKRSMSVRSSSDFRSIVDQLSDMVASLEHHVKPLSDAEFSIIVDVLHQPHVLFPHDSECDKFCRDGKFLGKLVCHTRVLFSEKQDNQVVRLLRTFRKMIRKMIDTTSDGGAKEIQQIVFNRYMHQSVVIQKKETQSFSALVGLVSPLSIQNNMDKAGASSLVVDIVTKNPNMRILLECVELAKALLDGGNTNVQKSFFNRFQTPEVSEKFFQVLSDRIRIAENTLLSSATASPLDIMGKKPSPVSTPRRGSVSPSVGGPTFPSPPSIGGDLALPKPQHSSSPNMAELGPIIEGHQLNLPLAPGGAAQYDSPASVASLREKDTAVVGREFKTPELMLIEPIFRFLQLLCENHNRDLQNFLRDQHSKANYDMISSTLSFLDILCGSTTGSLGLLGMYISSHNVDLLKQTLNTLTEYCQGPCHQNQNAIASHESNGLDVIISLVLRNILPLGNTPEGMAMVLDIKSDASKLLLAIMESRHDCENADRIISNMHRMESGPIQLIGAIAEAFRQSNVMAMVRSGIGISVTDDEGEIGGEVGAGANPLEVGHNIYILAHQLGRHNKDLAAALSNPSTDSQAAIRYYQDRTGEIEIVREDGSMEKIVFPIDEVCIHLTEETKMRVFANAEKDNQGSKVEDFFSLRDELYQEMLWQKELKKDDKLSQISQKQKTWSRLSVLLTTAINVFIITLYPFEGNEHGSLPGYLLSFLICCATVSGLVVSKTISKDYAIHGFAGCVILRLMLWFAFGPTVWLLGVSLAVVKTVHVVSYAANHGSHKAWQRAIHDRELVQLTMSLVFAVLGMFQVLFYAVLLLDVALREETLQNVISSVTRNIRSILLTAMLAIILVVLFAIAGFLFFKEDFVTEFQKPIGASSDSDNNNMVAAAVSARGPFLGTGGSGGGACPAVDSDDDDTDRKPGCEQLWGCFIIAISCGLRSGGGIGDCLRPRDPAEQLYIMRQVYDLSFFSLIILIVLNLIFGVIIDQFGDLRNERREKADALQNTCFICGLPRARFDNKSVTFKDHTQKEHFLWNYMYFMVLLRTKERTEFTGPESYVDMLMNDPQRCLEWFPRLRAMSLAEEEAQDPEQTEMKHLRLLLLENVEQVRALADQLESLRGQMNEQRSRRDRDRLLRNATHVPARNLAAL